jgi:hypothetical protein
VDMTGDVEVSRSHKFLSIHDSQALYSPADLK